MTNASEPTARPAPRGSAGRRIAITMILSVLLSLTLWFTVLNALTSVL